MICPVCDQLMIVLELNKVEIDYCPSCEGIWLDSGELELLLQDSSSKTNLLNSFQKAKRTKERKYRCPICSINMAKVNVGGEHQVLIDKCRFNHGLWFDKGELISVVSLGSLNGGSKVLDLLKEMFQHNLSTKPEE
jgi:Zn-finger nucleic acid-binding protein